MHLDIPADAHLLYARSNDKGNTLKASSYVSMARTKNRVDYVQSQNGWLKLGQLATVESRGPLLRLLLSISLPLPRTGLRLSRLVVSCDLTPINALGRAEQIALLLTYLRDTHPRSVASKVTCEHLFREIRLFSKKQRMHKYLLLILV